MKKNMMRFKKVQFICLCFLCFSIETFAQSIVKGTIISAEDKQPLPGVSVVIKGTSKGTVSDINGQYSIEAQQNAVLRFSFIGCKTVEEPVKIRKTVDVMMAADIKNIDEFVVMGYSSQKKAEVASSVVTISADALTDVTTSDIGNMLQGKVAGVLIANASGQPGDAAEIRIRGTGSINAEADPLYVVDGIPGGTFNPNDVETVTILKDAGATALYGAAAAGGVVVVTTKQAGKDQPTSVSLKTSIGTKTALFGRMKMMGSEELYYTQKDIYSKTLFKMMRPSSLLEKDFDWTNAAFSSGKVQDYYLSVSGSKGNTGYVASLDCYNEDGTLINTNFEKISARLNLNTELTKDLDMAIRVSYNNSNDQTVSSWMTLEDAYKTLPWDIPYDANGDLVRIDSSTRPDDQTDWYSQDKRNMLHSEQYNYAKSKSNQTAIDFKLNWQMNDWLSLSTTNRFDQGVTKYVTFIDPRSYNPSYAKGYSSSQVSDWWSYQTTEMLKASKSFDQHSINGFLGYEYSYNLSSYTLASGTGMPNGMSALNTCVPYEIGGNEVPGASWSAFGQAQYSYASKYMFTASFRSDASSAFAPKKRVGYFPSSSVAWVASKEDFLAGNDVISFLKLRASYGVTGNSNIGSFEYLSSYALTSKYEDVVAATPTRLANAYLGWESAYMTNFGVDVNLWKNLELNIDLYNIDNKDLLLNVPVAPNTGFFDIKQNIGCVRNQGVELQLTSTNIKTKNFGWNTSFNIAFNRNEVTDLPTRDDGEKYVFLETSDGHRQIAKVGQNIYTWYMPKWLGVDPANGDPLWENIIYDANGKEVSRESTNDYTQADQQCVGEATPLFSGGFINTLTYKNFSLNINSNFVYGNKLYNAGRESLDADGAYLGYNMLSLDNGLGWNRWKTAGDVATHPKLVMNGNKASNSISSRYLEDGSYLRIRNVTLGYQLPKNWMKSIKIQSCKIYVTADNLLTLTKFSGMDPEVTLTHSDYQLAGLYDYNYPVSRQILVGFEIKL
ncbi:MAG: SusC/RagA family TonB-linked outer membrane protein [Bacteroidales bacterium]|nr:SusC/RagA family TonB-linked outer membrane protein [Bacteroidales bacterium]